MTFNQSEFLNRPTHLVPSAGVTNRSDFWDLHPMTLETCSPWHHQFATILSGNKTACLDIWVNLVVGMPAYRMTYFVLGWCYLVFLFQSNKPENQDEEVLEKRQNISLWRIKFRYPKLTMVQKTDTSLCPKRYGQIFEKVENEENKKIWYLDQI